MRSKHAILLFAFVSCVGTPLRAEKPRSVSASKTVPKRVRAAAVAGAWYAGERAALIRQVDALLDAAPQAKINGAPIALISPHAGYHYSGKAAAAGFRLLKGRNIRRVVVLAVSHRVAFTGASIADVTHYETPLGRIPVDQQAVAQLRTCPLVGTVSNAHLREHSLEMQLPLLQRVLPDFQLVPILLSSVQEADYDLLTKALAEIIDAQTLVVASSDFTHRGPDFGYEVPAGEGTIKERLARLDQVSFDRILAIDRKGLLAYQKKTGTTICGLRPIALLLELLQVYGKAPKGQIITHYTSGDVIGDYENTVTYLDLVFTGSWPEKKKQEPLSSLSKTEKEELLQLARASLEASVKKGSYDPSIKKRLSPRLHNKAGAFVTLRCALGEKATCRGRGEDLRGCIGTLQPVSPLVETVATRAASAALEDPRFTKVTPSELSHLSVEVSVLTPVRFVNSAAEIIIGRHGIILEKNGMKATFLPHVAPRYGWDREQTLTRLAVKAGLGPDGWRAGATFSVYEAIVFAEGEH